MFNIFSNQNLGKQYKNPNLFDQYQSPKVNDIIKDESNSKILF